MKPKKPTRKSPAKKQVPKKKPAKRQKSKAATKPRRQQPALDAPPSDRAPAPPLSIPDERRQAILAMSSAGMSLADISAVVGIPVEELGEVAEYRLGVIQRVQWQQLEESFAPAELPENDEETFKGSALQRAFLSAFRITCHVTKASEAAGISRRMHYRWLEEDEAYQVEFKRAEREAAGLLEDEAVRRAQVGTLTPIINYGKLVGYELKYSDALLQQQLKARMPEKYRERYEHTGADGGPIINSLTVRFVDAPESITPDDTSGK